MFSPEGVIGLRGLLAFMTGASEHTTNCDITDAGCRVLAPKVTEELIHQFPWLADIDATEVNSENFELWLKETIRRYDEYLRVVGPEIESKVREIPLTEEYTVSLFDSGTGYSCKTERVVDITAVCPAASKSEPALLLFTRTIRGQVVQIQRPYPGESFVGPFIHFFVDELDREMRAAPYDDTFGSWSKRLGLNKLSLRAVIETHAPTA